MFLSAILSLFIVSCKNTFLVDVPNDPFLVVIYDKIKGKQVRLEKYDDKHRMIESYVYDIDGNVQSKILLSYEGIYPSNYIHQSIGTDTITYHSSYKKKGDTIIVSHFRDTEETPDNVVKEVYEEGKLINVLLINETGKSVTSTEYDQYNNLTQFIETLDGDTVYWKAFQIEYEEGIIKRVVAKDEIAHTMDNFKYTYDKKVLIEVFKDNIKTKEVISYQTIKPSYITDYEDYYFPKSKKEFDGEGNIISYTQFIYKEE